MADDIRIQVSGNVKASIARNIRAIAVAALEADNNLDVLRGTLAQFSGIQHFRAATNDVRGFRNEMNRATATHRTFKRSVDQSAASLLRASSAADRYGHSIATADARMDRFNNSVGRVRGGLAPLAGLFATAFSIHALVRAQDAMTTIQNQLKTVTNSNKELIATQETLFELANRTRSGISATVDQYVRYTNILKPLGVQQAEILRFTETLNKALIVAGSSAAEAGGATRQFVQGLQNGALRGEEFNSVMEQFPIHIIQAIADELGTTTTELRQLAEQGKITREVILSAFRNVAPTIDELFSRTLPTIGNALTILNNQFIAFMESNTGAATLLAQAIIGIGDNLHIVIPIIALFGAAWATVAIASILTGLVGILTTIALMIPVLVSGAAATLAFLAPWVALAAAVAIVVASILAVTGQLDEFIAAVGEAINPVLEMTQKFFGVATESVKASQGLADFSLQTNNASMSMQSATSEAKKTIEGITGVGDAADAAGQDIQAFSQQIDVMIWKLRGGEEAATRMYNALQAVGGASGSFVAVAPPSNGGSSITSVQPPAFATGGSFTVGGRPGIDKNMVRFRASRGERVDILTPEQQRAQARAMAAGNDNSRGAINLTMYVSTPDANSFRRSRSQIASELSATLSASV